MTNVQVDRIVAVVTTVGSMDDAQRLAHRVVDGRLAACVQLDEIASVYRWEGRVCDEPEVRLTMKTLPEARDGLVDLLAREHPYELPQITWTEHRCAAAYGDWVRSQVGDGP